jgi:hypothetical protein
MIPRSEASDSVYREAVAKLKILLSASEAVDRVSLKTLAIFFSAFLNT